MRQLSIDPNEYALLLDSVQRKYGYDFHEYAQTSVMRRVSHFMETNGIAAVKVLTQRLLADEELFEAFLQTVSVTVTEMFRDPSFFRVLRTYVAPRLATYPVIKIWIAGCATGQEIYSTVIILKEEGLLDRSVVYATDINKHSLQIAENGRYPRRHLDLYHKNYREAGGKYDLADYYSISGNEVVFRPEIKRNIVFSFHNLVADRSFNEFQLIICRNVLMYFNMDLQNKVVDLFCDSLCSFGFLGLGDKESLMLNNTPLCLEATNKREKLYRKVK